ncbi:MAG: hypothetical protein U5R06_09355 [candidate division KSB1 bacterium]|nr:hypothetical protein [candidate division KSB1 bacterium]
MGRMTEGLMYPDSSEIPACQGYIKSNCITLAEALRENGYHRDRNVWELYDMQADGTECHDRAAEYPDVVNSLKQRYFAWAERVGVIQDTDSLILARHADWF